MAYRIFERTNAEFYCSECGGIQVGKDAHPKTCVECGVDFEKTVPSDEWNEFEIE